MKRIFTYFLQGLLLLGPLAVTLYTVFMMFNYVDRLVGDPLKEHYRIDTPGIGIVILFVSLTLLGLVGQTIIVKPFTAFTRKLLKRLPLLNVIYTSINDLFTAFVGKEKKFTVPVRVCMDKENNLWRIGFITEKKLDEFGMKGMVAVYFPFSYSINGEMIMVPEDSVILIDQSPAEVMKFVISGGVTKLNSHDSN
ncbi:MAG TPA: DUF502 domain-containing protein [Prolixibacteraceae bacterium]|jgi:uncharacterized membrane protein|nr:DUF502 domain-containing protein [Prolixibacteraceae bacterium]HPR84400.1 DUF502 domain-containing protein [Prolixibacteraceae bacterium]